MYRFKNAQVEVWSSIFDGTLTVTYKHYRPSVGYNGLCKAIEGLLEMEEAGQGKEGLLKRLMREEARSGGIDVRGTVLHEYNPTEPNFKPERKGGMVVCKLIDKSSGKLVGYGESICLPEDDFHESAGRDLAFNYAVFDAAKSVFRSKGDITEYKNGPSNLSLRVNMSVV